MKKRLNAKAKLFGLALLAAGATVTIPAVIPAQAQAAEVAATTETVTETEKKTVTRTVRFYFKDDKGKTTPVKSSNGGDFVRTASATFERTVIKDKKTGKVLSAPDWGTTEFAGFDSPAINGYTPDIKTIPAVTVSPEKPPKDLVVYYTENPEHKKTLSTESKTVSRKITYYRINDDGSNSQTWSKTQSATFTRSVTTDGNGKKEYGAWAQHTFNAEDVAPMAGYTPDVKTVPAVTFTPDNPPSDVKVYFRKNAGTPSGASGDQVKAALTVKFTDGFGKVLSEQSVATGKDAVAPAAPTREGYTFAGWDKSFSNIQAPVTVAAKWVKNSTQILTEKKTVERKIFYLYDDGRKVINTEGQPAVARQVAEFIRNNIKDTVTGKITYGQWKPVTWAKMKAMEVAGYLPSISEIPAVTFTPDNVPKDIYVYFSKIGKKFFSDINPSQYYYNAVKWAHDKGIATGVNGLFDAVSGTSREQLVTFLWRAQGKPEPKTKVSPFRDVTNPSRYSYKAILWASENGIVTGTKGLFAPGAGCKRQEFVTILWRLAGKPSPRNMVSPFKDVTNKSSYSYKAILWAAENGITTGSDGKFFPNSTCKRCESIVFLYRYFRMIKKL